MKPHHARPGGRQQANDRGNRPISIQPFTVSRDNGFNVAQRGATVRHAGFALRVLLDGCMRVVWRLVALVIAGLVVGTLPGSAARDANPSGPPTGLEMLVFERQPCVYCDLFRREILPRYKASPPAARAPMRFVDIDYVDLETLGLRTRLTTIPTAVLMKNGAEVDRITGYTGPETFFQLIRRLLSRAD